MIYGWFFCVFESQWVRHSSYFDSGVSVYNSFIRNITKVDILSADISNKKISTYFPIFMDESCGPFVFVNSYKSKRIKNEFEFWKDKAIFFPSRKFFNSVLGGDKVLYKKLLKRYWINKLKEVFPTFYYLLGLSRHKDN